MNELAGKKILLGICGGIAAYKSAALCRQFKQHGADVRVIMTAAATRFITPLTLQALSGQPVHCDLFEAESASGMGHIELARWADRIVIAPATAQTIARLAHGQADDLLAATVLASESPVLLAPAMNHVMWQHPATVANTELLAARGVTILGPAAGEQACGENGPGRMLEPEEITEHLLQQFQQRQLSGKQVVITAGPTWEALDPVRGFTNHSSGKMGYALAAALHDAGAVVTLISGPTAISPPASIECINVGSAQEMTDAVLSNISYCDIFVGVAAVADYRPVSVAQQKIKKDQQTLTIEMVRNPDILAMVAALDEPPFTIGFAAETENMIGHAQQKLKAKGIDMIAANPVSGDNNAFNAETNELILIDQTGQVRLDRCSKSLLARKLTTEIARRYHEKYPAQDT